MRSGLGYLRLGSLQRRFSGGEAQRLNWPRIFPARTMKGLLYILDEADHRIALR